MSPRLRLLLVAIIASVVVGCSFGSPSEPPPQTNPAVPTTSPTDAVQTTIQEIVPSAPYQGVQVDPTMPMPGHDIGSWCKDGTWSDSTARGTCSRHGGVRTKVGW